MGPWNVWLKCEKLWILQNVWLKMIYYYYFFFEFHPSPNETQSQVIDSLQMMFGQLKLLAQLWYGLDLSCCCCYFLKVSSYFFICNIKHKIYIKHRMSHFLIGLHFNRQVIIKQRTAMQYSKDYTYFHHGVIHAMSPLDANQCQQRIFLPTCLPTWYQVQSQPICLSWRWAKQNFSNLQKK